MLTGMEAPESEGAPAAASTISHLWGQKTARNNLTNSIQHPSGQQERAWCELAEGVADAEVCACSPPRPIPAHEFQPASRKRWQPATNSPFWMVIKYSSEETGAAADGTAVADSCRRAGRAGCRRSAGQVRGAAHMAGLSVLSDLSSTL